MTKDALAQWKKRASGPPRRWLTEAGFDAQPGQICLVPGANGGLARVLVGIAGDGGADDLWHAAALPSTLPIGSYRLDPDPGDPLATRVAMGWGLGSYAFDRYRKAGRPPAALV
jgi:leucyl aminopeptidase